MKQRAKRKSQFWVINLCTTGRLLLVFFIYWRIPAKYAQYDKTQGNQRDSALCCTSPCSWSYCSSSFKRTTLTFQKQDISRYIQYGNKYIVHQYPSLWLRQVSKLLLQQRQAGLSYSKNEKYTSACKHALILPFCM